MIIPKTSKLYQMGKKEVPFDYQMLVDLSEEKMVSLSDDSVFQRTIDHLLEDQNLPNNKLIKVNDYEAAVQLAAGGLGWTMTMEYLLLSISDRDEYNFAELPSSLIQSDNGLTLHTESSAKTREVAREMADKIQDMLKKQGKIQ